MRALAEYSAARGGLFPSDPVELAKIPAVGQYVQNALRIGRQGEIRDRSSQAQEYRIAGLNLLAAIIIYWNTKQLGKIIAKRRQAGICDPEDLLSHVSPLGWGHILITGEYRWPKNTPKIP